ncbi:Ran-binding protein 9 [Chytridiales sp. JEL 0842]|nr:Ran-binding protein 9 [Chytridiales sp. JEL 0842]
MEVNRRDDEEDDLRSDEDDHEDEESDGNDHDEDEDEEDEDDDEESMPQAQESESEALPAVVLAPQPDRTAIQMNRLSAQPPLQVYPSYLRNHMFMYTTSSASESAIDSHRPTSHMNGHRNEPQTVSDGTPDAIPLSTDIPLQEFLKSEEAKDMVNSTTLAKQAPTTAHRLASPTPVDIGTNTNQKHGNATATLKADVHGGDDGLTNLANNLPSHFTKDEKPVTLREDENIGTRRKPPKDNHRMLLLAERNLRVNYIGPGVSDEHAASIRANRPIPPSCGIYYYEVKIVSKGRDGWMGIGLCEREVDMNRLPGWDPKSWGYHGDDGFSFESSGRGKPYGPTYTTGDVEIKIDFLFVGVAFKNISPKATLYPTVGMRTPNESLEANFGEAPFVFDIDAYVKDEQQLLWQTIHQFPVVPVPTFPDPPPISAPATIARSQRPSVISSTLNQLILSYLQHHGYQETAFVFRKSVVDSDVPDGVVNIDEERTSSRSTNTNADMMDIDGSSQEVGGFGNTFLKSKVRQDVRNHIMSGHIKEAQGLIQRHYPHLLKNNRNILFALLCRQFLETVASGSASFSSSGVANPLWEDEALEVGRVIMREFGKDSDSSTAVRDAIVETFSMMAYSAPWIQSPTKHLLLPSMREHVATLVDKAVLGSMGARKDSPLELLVKQSSVLCRLLTSMEFGAGVSGAGLLNVDQVVENR